MSYLIHASVVCELDDPGGGGGFNGSNTVFAGLLPVEPNLTAPNNVVIHHSGIGALRRVASTPGAGEFSLSGSTNQTITFGTAPESGDYLHATYVSA